MKIKVEKRIHPVYKEWIDSGKVFKKLMGKYQYIYESSDRKISMVKFLNYFSRGDNFWEIYSLKGGLFEDVERFKTKKEAIIQIKKYLLKNK